MKVNFLMIKNAEIIIKIKDCKHHHHFIQNIHFGEVKAIVGEQTKSKIQHILFEN